MNGGGIYNASGIVTLQNLTLMDNQAANGAGVYQSGGSTTIGNSLFHRNESTTYGGGIYNVSGALNLTNVTFSGNIASYGGGLYNSDQAIHMNVTYYLNQADIGGAIYNSAGSNQLTNTILAGSLSRDATSDSLNCDNAGTAVASNGYNLASDNSCALTNIADQPENDPILGPLQDNGGTTFTHDLLTGSPAIDAGTDSGCPATDQRGRPRPLGESCDIGAVEYGEVLYAIYLPLIIK
jgi:predicted outer membrane repeat protein